MFYNILDKKRLAILPFLQYFKKDFYLARGTGLALQIGHRDSIDFDFFSKENINTTRLFQKLKTIFKSKKILKVQEEKNTLTIILDESIKISFFTYNYELLEAPIITENLKLASILDIGCMKLSAIVSRTTWKDYIDLYFILQRIKLPELLNETAKKFQDLDTALILKSLTFFKDLREEPLKFKNEHYVRFKKVENFLLTEVQKYLIGKF